MKRKIEDQTRSSAFCETLYLIKKANLETWHMHCHQGKHLGTTENKKDNSHSLGYYRLEIPKLERYTKNVPTGNEERIFNQNHRLQTTKQKYVQGMFRFYVFSKN
jgi:hypothetical protein